MTHELFTGEGYKITRNKAKFSVGFFKEKKNEKLRRDICDWLRFHDFDPTCVPINAALTRDENLCRATATYLLRDEQGMIVHHELDLVFYTKLEYLEGPPLPFPLFGFEDFQERFQL